MATNGDPRRPAPSRKGGFEIRGDSVAGLRVHVSAEALARLRRGLVPLLSGVLLGSGATLKAMGRAPEPAAAPAPAASADHDSAGVHRQGRVCGSSQCMCAD